MLNLENFEKRAYSISTYVFCNFFVLFKCLRFDLIKFSVPKDANTMKISATYKDGDGDNVVTELRGISFYSANEMYVNVASSTEQGQLGENAIFHLRSNFAFQVYSYVVSIFMPNF